MGTSVSSTTAVVAPPMHTFLWQSLAGVLLTGVPSALLLELQIPALHKNVLQAVSVPQSASARHCTQVGVVALPLHSDPLFSLHASRCGRDGLDGLPLVHRSNVHPLPSTGRSL